jgi:hypothetical protein
MSRAIPEKEQYMRILFAITLICGAIACAGCGTTTPQQPAGQSTSAPAQQANQIHDPEELAAARQELAKLSSEDASSAQRQHLCPVSDELLGSMGPPKKVNASGAEVWICCEGCREQLVAEPEKYLAKINSP